MDSKDDEVTTRVLKVAQCLSVSGRSEITYQIGCCKSNSPVLRVLDNSGKGAFSKDWIATADIAQVIGGVEKVTALVLSQSLYPGKSTNSGGFLLAVLIDLGLIEVVVAEEAKTRSYVQKDASAFVDEVSKLLKSGVDLPADARPSAAPSPEKPVKPAGRGGSVKKVLQAPWTVS